MNIVWFSWKDKFHPDTGGAELMTDMALAALAKEGHRVTLITSEYPDSENKPTETSGYFIKRTGGRFGVYIKAWLLYFKQYRNSDVVVDEINAMPFCAPLILPRKKVITFSHHIQRKIWLYQMFFPLNVIGYIVEPLYYMVVALFKTPFFTVSESTKSDLVSYGVSPENIFINQTYHNLQAVDTVPLRNSEKPIILSLGSVRPMKRTIDTVRAFELVYDAMPQARLVIAGSYDNSYGKKVVQYVMQSRAKDNIEMKGLVDNEDKRELFKAASLVALSSVREGWCIVANEAHSCGVPTVVYDVHGLRDSTQNGTTGIVTAPNPKALAAGMLQVLSHDSLRNTLSKQALVSSRMYTQESAANIFIKNFNTVCTYE